MLLEPLGRASSQVIRVQPSLRDARPEHFLFEGERLSGLVDFGAMGVESVAADLARLIGEWLDGDPAARREALAAYERVRPLDPAEARLIDVFETTTALLIGERWVRWHYRREPPLRRSPCRLERTRTRPEAAGTTRSRAGGSDSF